MDKIVFIATHFEDSPEKALIPFVMSLAAYAMDAQPVKILQAEGVNLAVKGKASKIVHPPFDPLEKLFASYAEMGGKLLVCSPCLKARGFDEKDLAPNATIVGAAKILAEITSAKTVLSY